MNTTRTIDHAEELARDIDPELDPETAANVGRYMIQAQRRYRSNYWRAGGREY